MQQGLCFSNFVSYFLRGAGCTSILLVFPSIYFFRPFFLSLIRSRNSDPGTQNGLFSPLPLCGLCLHFYREETSALSAFVDSCLIIQHEHEPKLVCTRGTNFPYHSRVFRCTATTVVAGFSVFGPLYSVLNLQPCRYLCCLLLITVLLVILVLLLFRLDDAVRRSCRWLFCWVSWRFHSCVGTAPSFLFSTGVLITWYFTKPCTWRLHQRTVYPEVSHTSGRWQTQLMYLTKGARPALRALRRSMHSGRTLLLLYAWPCAIHVPVAFACIPGTRYAINRWIQPPDPR